MDPIIALFGIIIGGTLVGVCVHFIPCSAVGAMAATTGIATGPTMLAAGAGMMGLMAAAYNLDNGLALMLASGAIASMLMIALTSVIANITYAFGVGVAPTSGQSEYDRFTGFEQKQCLTPGTDGHGIPTQSFISGVIGAAIGGIGGALVFYSVYTLISPSIPSSTAVAIAGIIAVGIYIINGVLPAYTLVGKTEGMTDEKFKTTPKTFYSCLIMSTVSGIFVYAASVVI